MSFVTSIKLFGSLEFLGFGEIPRAVPKISPAVQATFVDGVHAVFHEDIVENHVCIAKIVSVANVVARFTPVPVNHLRHLLGGQMGMECLTEFECKGFGGWCHLKQ